MEDVKGRDGGSHAYLTHMEFTISISENIVYTDRKYRERKMGRNEKHSACDDR